MYFSHGKCNRGAACSFKHPIESALSGAQPQNNLFGKANSNAGASVFGGSTFGQPQVANLTTGTTPFAFGSS